MGQFCTACSSVDKSETRYNLNQTIISPFFPSLTFQFTNLTATKIPRNDCVIADVLIKHPTEQPYFS